LRPGSGPPLGGGSYSLYGFSVLQTQFSAVLISSLLEAKLQLGDPVDSSFLSTCDEIAINIACRDILRQCLVPQLAMFTGFNVSGLAVNAISPGVVQAAIDQFDQKVRDLLMKFESLGGVGSTSSVEYEQDTLGVNPEGP